MSKHFLRRFSLGYARAVCIVSVLASVNPLPGPVRAQEASSETENAAEPLSSEGEVEARINSFLTRHRLLSEQNDLTPILAMYADKVDYYARGLLKKHEIAADKRHYLKRWPERRYSLQLPPAIEDAERPSVKRVTFLSRFAVKRRGEHKTGTAENTFLLELAHPEIRIVGETSRVLRREDEPLARSSSPRAPRAPSEIQAAVSSAVVSDDRERVRTPTASHGAATTETRPVPTSSPMTSTAAARKADIHEPAPASQAPESRASERARELSGRQGGDALGEFPDAQPSAQPPSAQPSAQAAAGTPGVMPSAQPTAPATVTAPQNGGTHIKTEEVTRGQRQEEVLPHARQPEARGALLAGNADATIAEVVTELIGSFDTLARKNYAARPLALELYESIVRYLLEEELLRRAAEDVNLLQAEFAREGAVYERLFDAMFQTLKNFGADNPLRQAPETPERRAEIEKRSQEVQSRLRETREKLGLSYR